MQKSIYIYKMEFKANSSQQTGSSLANISDIDTISIGNLINKFAESTKVLDLQKQILEAIPNIKLDKLVVNCQKSIVEHLISRIIDVILLARLSSISYHLAGLCTTRRIEERDAIKRQVLSQDNFFAEISKLKKVFQQDDGQSYQIGAADQNATILKKNQICKRLTNNMVYMCFSYAYDLRTSRCLFRLLSTKAYESSCQLEFIQMHSFDGSQARILQLNRL